MAPLGADGLEAAESFPDVDAERCKGARPAEDSLWQQPTHTMRGSQHSWLQLPLAEGGARGQRVHAPAERRITSSRTVGASPHVPSRPPSPRGLCGARQAAASHSAREPACALRGCSPLAEGGAQGQRVRSYTRRPSGGLAATCPHKATSRGQPPAKQPTPAIPPPTIGEPGRITSS